MFHSTAPRSRWFVLVVLLMVGCGSAAPTSLPPATPAPVDAQPSPTAETPTEAVTPGERSLNPQSVTFQSGDGTTIAALYWPPVQTPSPGIVLMHMMGGSKLDWGQFATLLQGAAIAHYDPSQQSSGSFAVLAIDFRGHGDSGGSRDSRDGFLADAQAALNYMRTLPDVDSARIVMVGASIGADAAVDACGEGCIGAISLSPGGYLNVPYNDALSAMGDKPVLCVASAGDQPPADTCTQGESGGLSDYQVQIYQGSEHGTNMFKIEDQKPLLTDFLFAWLRGHVS